MRELAGAQTTWAAGQARAIALTSGKSISQSPRISPESMRIVFVRDSNLWIMNDWEGAETNSLISPSSRSYQVGRSTRLAC